MSEVTCKNCASDCTGTCSYTCSGTCAGLCGDSCTGTCKGGCEHHCAKTCYESCDYSCEGQCEDDCEGGCSDSCSSSCTGTCSTTCSTKCKGTCTGACNSGCKSETQLNNHTAVQQILARDIMYAADANILRDYIFRELSRRDKSGTATVVTEKTITSGSWWNTLRTNLEQVIAIDDTSAAGNVITKTARNEIINKAIQLYNQTIAKS